MTKTDPRPGASAPLLIGCLLWLMAASGWAEIYQWRDEQGRLHFSDEPPEKAPAKEVTLQPASGYTPPSAHREAGKRVKRDSLRQSYRSRSSSTATREQKANAARREANAKAKKEKNCRRYRDRYRVTGVRPARTVSGAKSQRDTKRYLRGKIKEYCR